MSGGLYVRIGRQGAYTELRNVLSLRLEREAYTPYESLTAVCRVPTVPMGAPEVSLMYGDTEVYLGLVDTLRCEEADDCRLLRITSKGFTALLTQNELAPGLHTHQTLATLLESFYTFPHLTYEDYPGTGYLYVNPGSSMWDGVASFAYQFTGHYPYVRGNCICVTAPSGGTLHTPGTILASGEESDLRRMVSHLHMEDINGNPDVYRQTNAQAALLEIVRHRHLPLDRTFLYAPEEALRWRIRYSNRGRYARYIRALGFYDMHIGDRVEAAGVLEADTVCRVRITFDGNAVQTQVWSYEDGFYTLHSPPA